MADKQQGTGEISLVGLNTTVEGKIKTEGSIRIDGKLVGDVVAKSNAAVGLTGTVEGSMSAQNISVAGKVSGTITAAEKLVLEGKSVVQGDIRAAKLVVDEGAMFDGQCAMSDKSGSSGQSLKEAAPRKL
ncbi:MAG: polymer-forming cytoskeletal protein [Ignavibacteriae bacterium]|nr:polymer-forming cytoskeletal protein [Ignavibacteriota bacterium]